MSSYPAVAPTPIPSGYIAQDMASNGTILLSKAQILYSWVPGQVPKALATTAVPLYRLGAKLNALGDVSIASPDGIQGFGETFLGGANPSYINRGFVALNDLRQGLYVGSTSDGLTTEFYPDVRLDQFSCPWDPTSTCYHLFVQVLNNRGDMIVKDSDGKIPDFLWILKQRRTIVGPAGEQTRLYQLNDVGEVVGSYTEKSSGRNILFSWNGTMTIYPQFPGNYGWTTYSDAHGNYLVIGLGTVGAHAQVFRNGKLTDIFVLTRGADFGSFLKMNFQGRVLFEKGVIDLPR